MANTLRFVVLAVLLVVLANAQTSLQTLVAQKEAAVAALVTQGQNMHLARCSLLSQCVSGSLSCSVPACGSKFTEADNFTCSKNYGSDPTLCDGGEGLTRSLNTAAVRVPLDATFTDGELQAFICGSNRLDATFLAQAPTLTAWQYMGSYTGGSRIFPGAPQERSSSTCGDYDPRLRPWYTAGASGPKDLVLVLDVSGSMSERDGTTTSRIELMRNAVSKLLDSTTANDFVQVVAFSGEATSQGNTLVQMTNSNREIMQRYVANLFAGGVTRMDLGFTKAFDILSSSTERTSSCTKVVVFLTDGVATEASLVDPAITAGQAKLGTTVDKHAHIFTFSMTSAADDVIPKRIACAHRGVWARIQTGVDPLKQMSQYYQFLAAGIDSSTVRWTTPYIDAFGLGEMVTAALPVYDRSRGLNVLVGVVGTDVTTEELRQFADANTVFSELIQRGSTCNKFSLSECQMQFLRSPTGYSCPADTSIGRQTFTQCSAANEIVKISACNGVSGGLNTVLCDNLVQGSVISASNRKTNKEALCCSGAGFVSVLLAVAAVIALML